MWQVVTSDAADDYSSKWCVSFLNKYWYILTLEEIWKSLIETSLFVKMRPAFYDVKWCHKSFKCNNILYSALVMVVVENIAGWCKLLFVLNVLFIVLDKIIQVKFFKFIFQINIGFLLY